MAGEIRPVSYSLHDEEFSSDNELSNSSPINDNSPNANYKARSVVERSHDALYRMNSIFLSSNYVEDLSVQVDDSEPTPTPTVDEKKKFNRAACLLSSFICVILLVGAISLGMIAYWNNNNQETVMRSPESLPSPEIESSSFQISSAALDVFCQNRSTIDYYPELFTAGYDITRANPLHKNNHGRPLFEHTLLRECRLTTSDSQQCQPSVHSVVIDNLTTYHQWVRHYLKFASLEETTNPSHLASIGAVSNSNNEDLLGIQTDLMSGSLIIMTHLSCPLMNVSRIYTPHIKKGYAQQLRLVTDEADEDEEELIELIEDFGAHYVDQAVIGNEVIIRFTLDRKTIGFFKRKNASLANQATKTGHYILSRSNSFMNISKSNQKIATDFIAITKTQIYSGSTLSTTISDFQVADRWIRNSLKQLVVIGLRVKPIDGLFSNPHYQIGIPKLKDKWRQAQKSACSRILPLSFTGKCQQNPKASYQTYPLQAQSSQQTENAVFVLPLLSLWTNRSTVCIRTSWNHCLDLCRNDPLCSAVTLCKSPVIYQPSRGKMKTVSSCPPEFKSCDCALHRQQDFNHGVVSAKVVTLVPVRQDLRPVTLRGFTVHGQPLLSVKQLTDLASCTRLCSRTTNCKIVSFSQYEIDHKICKLFANMTGNELRRKGHATTLFMMATFNQCFSDEVHAEKSSCPNNASCSSSYGMCVCLPEYYKNHTTCVSHNRHSTGEEDDIDYPEERQRTNKSHKIESISLSVQAVSKTIPEKVGSQSKVTDKQKSGIETSTRENIPITTNISTAFSDVASTTMRSKRGRGEIYPLRGSSVTSDYGSWQARWWRSAN